MDGQLHTPLHVERPEDAACSHPAHVPLHLQGEVGAVDGSEGDARFPCAPEFQPLHRPLERQAEAVKPHREVGYRRGGGHGNLLERGHLEEA